MGVREASKSILKVFLNRAIEQGEFKNFFVHYGDTMKEIGITDRNFFRICIGYIDGKNFVHFVRKDDEDTRLINLTAAAIDFIES